MPRNRTNLPFTFGLVGTFLIHGSLFYYVLDQDIHYLDSLLLNHPTSTNPSPTSSIDPSKPEPQKIQLILLPPPPPELNRFEIPQFGDNNGTGEGSIASEGDQPLQGHQADTNQPFLSLDPVGPLPGALPSPFVSLPGNPNPGLPILIQPAQPPSPDLPSENHPAAQGPFGAQAPPLPPTPLLAARPPIQDIEKPQTDTLIGQITPQRVPNDQNPEKIVDTPPDLPAQEPNRLLAMLDNILQPTTRQALPLLPDSDPSSPSTQPVKGPTTRATIALDTPKENPSTVGQSPDAPPTTQPLGKPPQIALLTPDASPSKESTPTPDAPQGNPGQAGLPVAPADPAPMADLESDPFSKKGAAVVHAGKLDVQIGRKVKPIRPQFNLHGMIDTAYGASVASRVSFDSTGKVTDVKILQTSGSNDIDLAVQVALYKWWFEPTTDKQGQPHPDVILLTISFY